MKNLSNLSDIATVVKENNFPANLQRDLTLQVLQILNKQSSKSNIIREVLNEIKKQTGINAIGIRLKDGDDFPYYETSGFSDSFVRSESTLCYMDKYGNPILDENGSNCQECLCGDVVKGRINSALPFYTSLGSFWTNSNSELIAGTSPDQLLACTRNRCNKDGYESVALIPLIADYEIIGLLQLNDHRKNIFTLSDIDYFEKLGNSVGIAMSRKLTDDKLDKSEKKLLEAQKIAQLGYYVFNITSGFWTSSTELDAILGMNNSCTKDMPYWLSTVHPDHREMMSSYLLNDILRQNKKFDREYKIIDTNTGETKWVHGLGNLKFDDDGNPIEMFGTIQDITVRKKSEEALVKSNIALKEILSTIESEKKEQLLSVQAHVNRTVLPLVRKLEIGANEFQANYISLIIDNLKTVVSPFVGKLEARFVNLSPRETEICKMLKNGMTSKEIAETLNTSTGTVFNQRKTIRKKLNIANDNINLVTFLNSI